MILCLAVFLIFPDYIRRGAAMRTSHADYSLTTTKRTYRLKVLFVIALIIFLFTAHSLLTTYIISGRKVTGDSMSPTLRAGSRVAVSPFYAAVQKTTRGGLVVISREPEHTSGFTSSGFTAMINFFTFQFLHPANNKQSTHYMIRRVVGLPGDTIYMKDFVLYVKPHGEQYFLTEFELSDIEYDITHQPLPNNWSTHAPFSGNHSEYLLGDHEYFVLCDNRIISSDSRTWGIVTDTHPAGNTTHRHTGYISGGVLFRYWPVSTKKAE